MLKNNPSYKPIFHSTVHNCDFYAPAQDADYHLSRYVAAQAQNIYSACGINKDLQISFLNKIIEICNDETVKKVRTDVAILANNLLYRTRYPVDEDCALRMGAIYVFHEDEDPNVISDVWTQRKVDMCKGMTRPLRNIKNHDGTEVIFSDLLPDPELYTFFLTEGIKLTAAWSGLDSPLTNMDYFKERNEALATYTPQ